MIASAIFEVLLVILMISSVARGDHEVKKTELYIVSVLPYPVSEDTHPIWHRPTLDDGPDIAPVVYLAVDQINKRTDLLGNYTLHVIETDGGCNIRSTAYTSFVQVLYNTLYFRKRVVGFVGPGCSDSALVLASLTSEERLPSVSLHLGIDPALVQYPYAFGMIDSSSLYVEALMKLLVYSNWTQVNILYEENNHNLLSVYQGFSEVIARRSDIDIKLSLSVSTTYLPLKTVKEEGSRIVFSLTGPDLFLQLMCLAYHTGLIFPTYQWVFIDRPLDHFTEVEFVYQGESYYCSCGEMHDAVENNVALFLDLQVNKDMVTISGQTYPEFIQDYNTSIQHYKRIHGINSRMTVWANPIYDATWALALALNASVEILANNDPNTTTESISKELKRLRFTGMSGPIAFNADTGFSSRTQKISQFKNGSSVAVGNYSNRAGLVIDESVVIVSDEFEVETTESVAHVLAISVLVAVSLPLVLTIFTDIISIVYHRYKPIKSSSHRLNQLAYIGYYILTAGVVVVTSSYIFNLDSAAQDVVCVYTTWTSSIGISLILGTICMKSWRLYKLYISAQQLKPLNNGWLLKDPALALGVVAIVLPEIVLLVIRTVIDRPQWREISHETSGVIIRVHYGCIGEYDLEIMWVTIQISYKCLIAAFAFFFAQSSRKLQRKGVDMKNLILLVYVMAFFTASLLPLVLFVFTRNSTSDILFGILLLWLSYLVSIEYICAALLFLPPVFRLFHGKWKGEFNDKSFWATRPSIRRRTTLKRYPPSRTLPRSVVDHLPPTRNRVVMDIHVQQGADKPTVEATPF